MNESSEGPTEISVEFHVLAAYLCHDYDYMPYKSRVFLHRVSGEWLEVFDNDYFAAQGGISPTENGSRRLAVETRPQDFLEIPIPDHGTRHKWLREFLKDLDRESEYFGSIGGWLKEHAEGSDGGAWRDFEMECVITHAVAVAAQGGITLNVTSREDVD